MFKKQKGNSLLAFFIMIGVLSFCYHGISKINQRSQQLIENENNAIKEINNEAVKFKKLGIAEFITINYYKPCFDKNNFTYAYFNLGYIDLDCAVKTLTVAKLEGDTVAKNTRAAIEVWSNLPKTSLKTKNAYFYNKD